MTTSAYSPAPSYAISGIGPYDVSFEYGASDEVRVSILVNDILQVVDPANYSVIPVGPATSGTVFLTPGYAAAHDGEILVVARDTTVAQSWDSLGNPTASGLEAQLDSLSRAIQENQNDIERSLRVVSPLVTAYEPQDGRVPYWDSTLGTFTNGLNYAELEAGIAAATTANDRVDVAIHAISGGKWRADVTALLADTELTYTTGQTGTVAEGDKIATQAEGFGYTVAASGATVFDVTTAGGVKLIAQAGTSGYDVRLFGARGDGVEGTTGAITAGGTTFTDTSAAFDAGDVGKVMIVRRAGASPGRKGANLVTTITAVNSPTSVELADAAITTVSGGDYLYGTDDTATIQAAIDANRTGQINFPRGIYLVTSLLVGNYTQVSLTGETGTYIKGSIDDGPLLNYGPGLVGGWRETSAGVTNITFDGLWDPDPTLVNDHGFDFSAGEGLLVAWRNDNMYLEGCSFFNAPVGLALESNARLVDGTGAHVYGVRIRNVRFRRALYGVFLSGYDPANPTTYVGPTDISGGWFETLHKAAFAGTGNILGLTVSSFVFDNVPFLHAFGGLVKEVHFAQGQYELGYKDDELQSAGYPAVLDFSDVIYGWDTASEDDLVTNGAFDTDTDWTKGGSWAIAGGLAEVTAAAAGELSQNIGAKDYLTYEVTLDATVTAGALLIGIGEAPTTNTITATGSHTLRIQAPVDGDGSLRIAADASFVGSVDNVSVKLVRHTLPFWDDNRASQKQLYWGYADTPTNVMGRIRYDHLRTAMYFDRDVQAIAGVEDAPNIPTESVVDRIHTGDGSSLRIQSYYGDKGGVGPSLWRAVAPDDIAFKKAIMVRSPALLRADTGVTNLASAPASVGLVTMASGANLLDVVADGLLFPQSVEVELPPNGSPRFGLIEAPISKGYYLWSAAVRVVSTSDGESAILKIDAANQTNIPGRLRPGDPWRTYDLILPASLGLTGAYFAVTNLGANTAVIRVGDVQAVAFESYHELLEYRAQRLWAGAFDTVTDRRVAKLVPQSDGMILTTRYSWDASTAAYDWVDGTGRFAPDFLIDRMEARLVSGTAVDIRGGAPASTTWWFSPFSPTSQWQDVSLNNVAPSSSAYADRQMKVAALASATMTIEFRTRFRYR